MRLSRFLRVLAVMCAVAVISCWILFGAHLGWTQTALPIKKVDPITAIEFTDYESGFVAGVDFLAGGLLVAFAIFTLSLAAAKLERNKWL
jgi:hypothetical protein